MNGVVKSIDSAIEKVDRVLSSRRLKRSLRSEIESIRHELLVSRAHAVRNKRAASARWLIQLMSLVAKVSDLVDRYFV